MSGIFGVIHKPVNYSTSTKKNIKLIKKTISALALASQEIGRDSTGIAVINRKIEKKMWVGLNQVQQYDIGGVFVYKDNVPAEIFIKSPKYLKILEKLTENTAGIMGHTKSAFTSSPKNNYNNLPHVCNNVVGVHAGTILNWAYLADKFNLELKGECNSEIIFSLIDMFMSKENMPLHRAIKQTASLLEGSFACMVASIADCGKVALFRRDAAIKIRYKTLSKCLIAASNERYIRKVFKEVEWEDTHSSNFFNLNEIVLPNNHGIVFNTNENPVTTLWAESAESFELKT